MKLELTMALVRERLDRPNHYVYDEVGPGWPESRGQTIGTLLIHKQAIGFPAPQRIAVVISSLNPTDAEFER